MSKSKRGGDKHSGGRLGRSLVKEKSRSKRSARGDGSWVGTSIKIYIVYCVIYLLSCIAVRWMMGTSGVA